MYREKTLGAKSISNKAASAMNLGNIGVYGLKSGMDKEDKKTLCPRKDIKESEKE